MAETYVTIRDLAIYRGAGLEEGVLDGGPFAEVGLGVMGGCEVCGAMLLAQSAYPSKSGYWRCRLCIAPGDAWTDVAEADRDIFGADAVAGVGA